MAKASTHIAPGNAGYFSHNSRQSFSQSQVFFDEANEIGSTKEEAFTIYRSQLKERSNAYETRVGQKLQNKTVTHLSAVVNLEQHHTMEDLSPLVKYIETQLDTNVTQVAIHRDEGKLVNKETGEILTSGEQFFCDSDTQKLYFDKDFVEPIDMSEWDIEKNYHAHIEFMGLTSEGKSIKRELTTRFFRALQDKTAEILKMERGEKTQPSYTKEQMQEIKKALKPKKEYANDKAYGKAFTSVAKDLGYWKPKPSRTKRRDTHDYKADKAIENELIAKAITKAKNLKEKTKERNSKRKKNTKKLIKEIKEEQRQKMISIGEFSADKYAKLNKIYNALLAQKNVTDIDLEKANLEIVKLKDIQKKTVEKASNIFGNKNTEIAESKNKLKVKDAEIVKLEIEKKDAENALQSKNAEKAVPSIQDSLKCLSAHSSVSETAIFHAIDSKIKEANNSFSISEIEYLNPKDAYEYCYLAGISPDDGNLNTAKIPTEDEQRMFQGRGLRNKISTISEALSSAIREYRAEVSETWQKLRGKFPKDIQIKSRMQSDIPDAGGINKPKR